MVLLAAASLLDCGGYQPPTLGACSDGTPLDDAECPSASFVAADRCFETKLAACECLTCGGSRCLVEETSPARVRCGAEAAE